MSEKYKFFQDAYGENSDFGRMRPPWDIDGPQPVFVELEQAGAIGSEVLDAGFGPGGVSLYLASRGYAVTGVDQAPQAVEKAAAMAAERGLDVTFALGDLLDLSDYRGRFDTVVECGVFHGLTADEQARYAASLHGATRPRAVAHLFNLSEQGQAAAMARCAELGAPPQALKGFHPVTREQLRTAFGTGWTEESITGRPMRLHFPGDEAPVELHAWLATFRRV
ncbi:hypothetical protein GCM10027168_02540 [Streptomyces capparidis]